MSEFLPVATLADLKNLDEDEILAGYREGLTCDAEPGSDKSRGYWHGWRNAQMDRGRMQHDASSSRLVREYLGSGVSGH